MSEPVSLQDRYAPNLLCFGCGPANEKGLRIKSFVEGDRVVASFTPEPHQLAFEGIVNGGIIGVLLDCHLNWAAAWHLMEKSGLETPPCCVTARYEVMFKKPTPTGVPLHLEAWVTESTERRAVVEGTLGPDGQITATGKGTFVAVKPDHPAYHRW